MAILLFSVNLLAQNNQSNTLDFSFEAPPLHSYLSFPSLLLVDNDWSFDNKGLKINCVEDEAFELKYCRLLEDLGYSHERYIVPSTGQGPDSAFMQSFDAVIWVMGDNPLLNSENRTNIASYLENGGRFFIIFPDPYMYPPFDPNSFDPNISDPETFDPNSSILSFFQTYLGISRGDNKAYTPSTIVGISGNIMDSVNTNAKSDWSAGWSPSRNFTDNAFFVNPVEGAAGLIHSYNTDCPYLAVAYSPDSPSIENAEEFKSLFFGFELTFVTGIKAVCRTPRSVMTLTARGELSRATTSCPLLCRYSACLPAPPPISSTRPTTLSMASCSEISHKSYSLK